MHRRRCLGLGLEVGGGARTTEIPIPSSCVKEKEVVRPNIVCGVMLCIAPQPLPKGFPPHPPPNHHYTEEVSHWGAARFWPWWFVVVGSSGWCSCWSGLRSNQNNVDYIFKRRQVAVTKHTNLFLTLHRYETHETIFNLTPLRHTRFILFQKFQKTRSEGL